MSEMHELYDQNAYIREFDSEVVSCTKGKKGYEVILKDTAFYPEGGGQPCDLGMINDAKVLDVKKKDGIVVHTTDKPLAGKVHGTIDWQRRFHHMQTHSGEHIVSGLIHRKYGYDNVGFHMGDTVLCDFDGELTKEQLREIENEANQIIWYNVEALITFPSEEELKTLDYRSKKALTGIVRIVEFPGADVCACCGTHVRRTGEIGLIRILSSEKHGQGTRISMVCGSRALEADQLVADQNRLICAKLSAPAGKTAEAVDKLIRQNEELKKQNSQMAAKLMNAVVDETEENQKLVIIRNDFFDANMMRKLADTIADRKKAGIAVMLHQNGPVMNYVILSHTTNLREYSKKLNDTLKGHGGGSREMIQGVFASDEETIRKVLQETFA